MFAFLLFFFLFSKKNSLFQGRCVTMKGKKKKKFKWDSLKSVKEKLHLSRYGVIFFFFFDLFFF